MSNNKTGLDSFIDEIFGVMVAYIVVMIYTLVVFIMSWAIIHVVVKIYLSNTTTPEELQDGRYDYEAVDNLKLKLGLFVPFSIGTFGIYLAGLIMNDVTFLGCLMAMNVVSTVLVYFTYRWVDKNICSTYS